MMREIRWIEQSNHFFHARVRGEHETLGLFTLEYCITAQLYLVQQEGVSGRDIYSKGDNSPLDDYRDVQYVAKCDRLSTHFTPKEYV
jgi:hypothetical protein